MGHWRLSGPKPLETRVSVKTTAVPSWCCAHSKPVFCCIGQSSKYPCGLAVDSLWYQSHCRPPVLESQALRSIVSGPPQNHCRSVLYSIPQTNSVALYSQNHYRPVLQYSGGTTADQCYTCRRTVLEPLQTRVSVRTTADPCHYQNHCRPVSLSEPLQTRVRVSIRTTADPCQY